MKGAFITFEGTEGSGKTTQISRLAERLRAMGHRVRTLREPGGTPIGEEIRHTLKHSPANHAMTPEAELLLMNASRAQLVREVIRPALATGEVVLCDRFYDSTTAYQGYGRGLPLKTVNTLNNIATSGLKPDITFVFDIPDRIFAERERLAQKLKGPDRIERESAAFRKRVNRAYKIMSKKSGVDRVNGALPVADIRKEIIGRVGRLIGKH